MRKRLKASSVWITALALVLWLAGTHVHSQAAPVLISDQVSYDSQSQLFMATGNVEVYFDGSKLTAPTVTYDKLSDRFSIEGPFVLVGASGSSVTYGEFADLSSDLADGVIYAVNQIIEDNLQVSANKVIRSSSSLTQFDRVRASSCRVCSTSDIPLWEVRAREAWHDDEAKTVTFRHAQLRIRNVPVAYTPWLRLPDPSVERSDGFLAPVLSINSLLGNRVGIPYFKTMGNHADVTVTPYLGFQSNVLSTVEGRYRKRFYSGFLELNGALSSDDFTERQWRSYLFTNGQFNFENGVDLEFSSQAASDSAYIGTYDFFERDRKTLSGDVLSFQDDRLNDNLRISQNRPGNFWELSYKGFKPLRDSNYLYELPNHIVNSQWVRDLPLGNRPSNLKFNLVGQLSANEFGPTNSRQLDISRGSANLVWRDRSDLHSGFALHTDFGLFWDSYRVTDDLRWPSSQSGMSKFVASKLERPISLAGGNETGVFTPSVQLMYYTSSDIDLPVVDGSTIHLLDAYNHAGLGRFRRVNREQDGASELSAIEFGLSYKYDFMKDYYLGGSVEQDFFFTSEGTSQREGRLYTFDFGKDGEGLTYSLTSQFNGDGKRISDGVSFTLPLAPVTLWGDYSRQDLDPIYAVNFATERWKIDLSANFTPHLTGAIGTAVDELSVDQSFTTASLQYDDGWRWRASTNARFDRNVDRYQQVNAEIRRRTKWGGDIYVQHLFDYDTTSRAGFGVDYSNECASFVVSLFHIKNAATGLDSSTEFKVELKLGSFGTQHTRKCG